MNLLGVTGQAGAGKDTFYERLHVLGGNRFVRLSVADSLKDSIAALFGVSLEHLDELKRDAGSRVELRTDDPTNPMRRHQIRSLSVREFMQRYGTEAHRDLFGEDFWLMEWIRRAAAITEARRVRIDGEAAGAARTVIVNTSVRFPNEAKAILGHRGIVVHVHGPQDKGAGDHPSERALPGALITEHVDNEIRSTYDDGTPDFTYLDAQVSHLLAKYYVKD